MRERSSRLTWLILAVIAILILVAVAACWGGGDWLWHQLLALHGMGGARRR